MDATQRTPRPRSRRWTPVVLVARPRPDDGRRPGGPAPHVRGERASRLRIQASAAVGPSFPPAWNQFLSGAGRLGDVADPAFTLPVQRTIWQILNGDPTAIASTR